ncbi:MAG: hypothetical protein HZA01_12400 [Nitrospinae bacterium]|nr:hypothetical protein [Nitrospinota bacterium]
MKFDTAKHHRRSIRLKGADYSLPGAYFITICAQNRESLFGKIVDGAMCLNDAGKMVDHLWNELKNKFVNIEIDKYAVMPNHFHGIIIVGASLVDAQNSVDSKNPMYDQNYTRAGTTVRAGTRPAPTIGDIVGAFKSLTTNEYIRNVKSGKFPPFEKSVWQRNYYERIIRNENDLNRIREYIVNNPLNWDKDDLFVNAHGQNI